MSAPSEAVEYPAASADTVASYLVAELSRAAAAMADQWGGGGARSLRPLHQLQAWCDRVLADSGAVEGMRVQLYVLGCLLEDAFDNLTGDFFYDELSEDLRKTFFGQLFESIRELATISPTSASEWQPVLERMIRKYVEVVAALNRHVESIAQREET